jgi:hypothetical protein
MILVGTRDGMFDLDGKQTLAGRRIDVIAGRWVLTDGSQIHRDDELVASFDDARLNWVLPLGETVLLGAAAAGLYELTVATGGIARNQAFDQTPGRERWYTPWGGPPDVRSMDRGTEGRIYVNVHVGGVIVSDGGNWRDTMDIDADVHQVIAHPERDDVALVAAARGLAITKDGAASWQFFTEGLHATYCRAVAVSGDTVFVSASRSNRGERAAVYRTDLDGSGLKRLTVGLPEWFSTNVDTGCLAASGDTVVIGDADGTLYVSEDRGDSFTIAEKDLPGITRVAIR